MIADQFDVRVREVVAAFRAALDFLTTPADRIGLEWRDASTHDDWEELAEAVFDTFVTRSVGHDASTPRDSFPLPRYDFDIASYADRSWIELSDDFGVSTVFVRLLTTRTPFDTVHCAIVRQSDGEKIGAKVVAYTEELSFRLRLRSAIAHDLVIDELNLSD